VLTLSGTCNYGDADELEATCRRWGLSYWKAWDAMSGVFDAGVTIWKPGMEDPESENADCSAGEPMMTLSQLVKAKNQRKSLLDIVAELERFLSDKLPPLSVSDENWIDPE
jgi:hypothetical protein